MLKKVYVHFTTSSSILHFYPLTKVPLKLLDHNFRFLFSLDLLIAQKWVFLTYTCIRFLEMFLPTQLLGTACLLYLGSFSYLHVYLGNTIIWHNRVYHRETDALRLHQVDLLLLNFKFMCEFLQCLKYNKKLSCYIESIGIRSHRQAEDDWVLKILDFLVSLTNVLIFVAALCLIQTSIIQEH